MHPLLPRLPLYAAWLLLSAALLVVLPSYFSHLPGNDSGMALFIADRLLAGDALYVDWFTAHMPMIYWIDAAALWLAQRVAVPAEFGVWFVESAFLVLALGVSLYVVGRPFGAVPAVVASVAWAAQLPLLIDQGNQPAEYALLWQFSALALVVRASERAERRSSALGIGVSAGLTFLLSPGSLGLWLAIALTFCIVPRRWSVLAWMAAGFAATLGAGVTWLLLNGSFGTPSATTFSGAVPVWQGIASWTYALAAIQQVPPLAGLGYWMLLAWIAAALALAVGVLPASVAKRLCAVAVVALPIELMLLAFTAEPSPRDLLPLLPCLALLTAAPVAVLSALAARLVENRTPQFLARWSQGLCAVLVLSLVVPYLPKLLILPPKNPYRASAEPLARAIARETDAQDRILVWGADGNIYRFAERLPASRWFAQRSLVNADDSRVAEFLNDVDVHRPAVIIDVLNQYMPPLSSAARAAWLPTTAERVAPQSLQRFFDQVDRDYVQISPFVFVRIDHCLARPAAARDVLCERALSIHAASNRAVDGR